MAVPIEKIRNKGVEFTHTGDLPSYCIRCGKPPEMFMVKRAIGPKSTMNWVEFFCHEHFNREMDDIMMKNPFKPGLKK